MYVNWVNNYKKEHLKRMLSCQWPFYNNSNLHDFMSVMHNYLHFSCARFLIIKKKKPCYKSESSLFEIPIIGTTGEYFFADVEKVYERMEGSPIVSFWVEISDEFNRKMLVKILTALGRFSVHFWYDPYLFKGNREDCYSNASDLSTHLPHPKSSASVTTAFTRLTTKSEVSGPVVFKHKLSTIIFVS